MMYATKKLGWVLLACALAAGTGWADDFYALKVGQLHIQDLRARATDALGDRFSIADFHDVVLGSGAVTLPVLTELVDGWVASR